MQDILYRGIIAPLDVRFVLAECPETAQEIILRHNCDPASAHVVARAVGAATLISALLNEDEKYTIRWSYKGRLTALVADCTATSQVRAFINPTNLAQTCQSEKDIYGEDGTLTLIKSTASRVLSSGTSQAPLMDVVDDLAFALSYGDQVETAMACLVAFRPDPERPVKTCRAVMLQALPGCDLRRFDRLRNKIASPQCRAVISGENVQDNLFERFAMELTRGETDSHDYSMQPNATPTFYCTCNRQRMLQALHTMAPEELDRLFKEQRKATVTCQFCNSSYDFTRNDLN